MPVLSDFLGCSQSVIVGCSDQVGKQGPVVDHRLPQVFGRGFSTRAAHRDVVCGAVVLYDPRVIHGKIRGLLLEVLYRVTARVHHLFDQAVCFCNCLLGFVHESGLNQAPPIPEGDPFGFVKRRDVERPDALLALVKLGFRKLTVARHRDRSVVLRSEVALELS
jgi:hypothetical protein